MIVASERELRNRPFIVACVMMATIMQALDTTIANVALPYMQGSLGATQDQINWVLTSYIVSAAIMMPPIGWLVNRFGRKTIMVVAVAGFTVSSMLCGGALSLEQIVLYRVMQGVFGAALVPLSQSVMLDLYPPEKQGSAMAIWGVGVMVGPILGPTLGGWLTETWSWRWVFFVNMPFGILTVLGLLSFLDETKRHAGMRFDWTGFALLSVAIGALQIMLDRGQQLDWFGSTEIVAEAVTMGLCFYLFVVHMLTTERPFVNPALFRDRNLVTGLAVMFVVGIVLLATIALLAPYLQTLMGYPVLTAGLVLGPRGVGTMISMMLVGRLVSRMDPRWLVMTGLTLTTISLYEMSYFTPDVSQWTLIRVGLFQGFGLGFVFVPMSTVSFATLAPSLRTDGAVFLQLVRNIGSSIGVSVVIFLLVRYTTINHAELVQFVSPFNAALLQPDVAAIWNLHTQQGLALLDNELSRQGQIIAYANDFRLMMFICLIAIPFLFVIRRPGRAASSSVAAAAME